MIFLYFCNKNTWITKSQIDSKPENCQTCTCQQKRDLWLADIQKAKQWFDNCLKAENFKNSRIFLLRKNPKIKMESSDESTLLVSQMLEKLCLATDEERKSLLNEARPHLIAPDASARFKEHLENPCKLDLMRLSYTKWFSRAHATCKFLVTSFLQ